MIAQIGEHGELIAAQLENNKEVASLKEMQEQQTNERILAAILDVAGSIESGHEAVAEAVSGGSEAVADSLDVGQERIADTLTAGHTKISETLTAGHTKLAETGANIATAITSGDQKIEAAISQTGESLDLIKGSVDMQSERIHSGLDSVVSSLEEAGQSSKEGLAEISLKLQQSGEAIKTAGEENKAGLDSLGTQLETVGTNMAELKDNVISSSSDTKSALESIAANVGQAASSSGQVATSLGTLSQENKEGLDNLKTAITEFMRQQTTDTSNVILALDALKAGTDSNSLELKTELDQIEAAITAAQSRDVQLNTIRRLADKIECTTDCFTSDDQADAIVRGLNRTDMNMRDLVDDINNYASNGREANIERRQVLVPSLVEARLMRGLARQGGAPADPGCYEPACEANSTALITLVISVTDQNIAETHDFL